MRKKFLRVFLAVLLFSCLFTVTAYAESAVVTGDNVNLRSGPGMSYRVLDVVPQGETVTVQDRSNSEWYAVTYDGTYGFMSASLLSLSAQSNTAVTVVEASGSGRINAMYVRFRSGPSSDSSILGEYNLGKELTITGRAGAWTECIIDGQRGFVLSDYISDEDDAVFVIPEVPSPTPAPAPEPTVYPDPVATKAPTPTKAPAATPAPTKAPASNSGGSQVGYVAGDYVCFRNGPSTSHTIINTYNRGKELLITGTTGDWSMVTIDGEPGYMYSQYVMKGDGTPASSGSSGASSGSGSNPGSSGGSGSGGSAAARPAPCATPAPTPTPVPVKSSKPEDGYITGNYVRFRSGPSMSSAILEELFYGNVVTITGTSGDWTAVTFEGEDGFVFSTYVAKGKPPVSESGSGSSGGGSGSSGGTTTAKVTGREIADFALQFVGYNYRWGGASPATGFDCSGLVYYVYGHYGYELNRVACDQATNGRAVSKDKLQPGDIICFYSGGDYIGHVGIYIGNNMFVHAANSTSGVITSSLTGYYATRGYVCRRIL